MGERGLRLVSASRIGAALTLLAGAQTAQAGAWPKQPGASEVITSFATKVYDHKPENELDLYAEHGVRQGWTMVGGLRGWSRGDEERTFAQLGLRRQFKHKGAFVAATETRVISGRDWNDCGGWGLESRALAGKSMSVLGHQGFVDVEAAARTFSDGCTELRLEGSAGSVPDRGVGFLLQANAEKLLGAEKQGGLSLRLQGQASATYALSARLKLQLGARLGFENSRFREQALIIGLWRSF